MPIYLNNKRIAPTKLVYSGGYETYTGNYTINPAITNIILSTTNKILAQDITITAMPSLTLPQTTANFATSGYTLITTIDRSTSDQYINIGTGYNNTTSYYKIPGVPNGTPGTPIASKGTVTNNTINITPSVTNSTGYITGSTINGTAISVSANELVSGTLSITSNGTKDVTNYKNVNVQIGSDVNNQDKTVTPSASEQIISADSGYSGLGTVTVNAIPGGSVTAPTTISGSSASVSSGTNTITLTKTISVTPNVTSAGYVSSGTAGDSSVSLTASITTKGATSYTPTTSNQIIASGTYLTGIQTILGDSNLLAANIRKNVSIFGVTGTYEPPTGDTINNQDKTVTPTESEQSITFDSGYTGLGIITVNAISSNYIGSNIARKSSTDLTVSDETITVPAGYYATNANKSVATTTHPNPTANINSTTGLITASHTQSTGYVTGGTTTDTLQLSTQAAATITPTTSSQVAITAGKYTLGAITVGAIPSQYIIPTGTKTITQNGTGIDVSQYANVDVVVPNTEGSGGYATFITDTLDEHGGIIRSITGIDLSADTVSPSTLLAGYTAHDSTGEPIVGEALAYTAPNLQAKINITPTESSQTISADAGYDGLSSVQINAISSSYIGSGIAQKNNSNITQGTWSYSTNGVYGYATCTIAYDAGYYSTGGTKDFTKIIADIENLPTLAATTITPTESLQTAVNKFTWTTGDITVAAISPSYVGSGITQRSSTDLTASGATVTVPAGYYSSQVTKSVATMTLPTTAAANATSGYTSKATIGRSTSAQYINIPPGYNASGAYYLISATPNGSATGPTSLSGTSATVTTGTNTLTLTKTGITTTPTVSAGYVSSATTSTATVTLTASVTTKAAATITPTKSAQTIAAGTYLTGIQTIAAIPAAYQDVTSVDATASDVISNKKIVDSSGTVITGTLVVQTIYSGSSAPSSSTGVNGDIYIQTQVVIKWQQ